MKTLLKFVISLVVGCILIVIGLTLGGFQAAEELLTNFNLDSFVFNIDLFPKEKQDDISMIFASSIQNIDIEVNNAIILVKEHESENIKVEAKNILKGFEVYENDERSIQISQKKALSFGNKKTADIVIYVPQDYKFNDVDVVGGGYIKIEQLSTNSLSLDGGVGAIEMKNIIADDMNIDTGFCATSVKNLECLNLEVDLGFGALNVDMKGNINDYDTLIDVGFGSVNVNNQKYAGISSNYVKNNYNNKCIEVNCAFGAVEIRGGL